jgi:hypothetical protein
MGFTMLCDVISAVAEFMVRVLHPMMVLRLKSGHACGVISVATEIMVNVAGVEVRPCM